MSVPLMWRSLVLCLLARSAQQCGFPLLEGRSWHHVERPCRWRASLRPRTLPKLDML